MAGRPTWKGSLRLSLITIPIRVFPATNASSDVSFRQLHRKCHTPIQLKKWCPHCEEEVPADAIVKGYESSKGQYVVVEEKEIANLRPETTHVVDLAHVVDASQIDPIYIERSYYIAPDSKPAGPAFSVFRQALEGKAAIGHLALHGREYLVAILPREDVLLLHTLRTAGEVLAADAVSGLEFAETKVRPEELKLARQVLDSLRSDATLSSFTDHYQDALRDMLAKKRPEELAEPDKGTRAPVVNLMEALRQSLAHASTGHKRTAAGSREHRVLKHPGGRHAPSRRPRKAS